MSNPDINLFRDEESEEVKLTPDKVVCLGVAFESDDARRAYFREELRKKLPELRQIEGFPIGEDEDIINLSDPPYYTACPNPWLNDFVAEWEQEKVELEKQGKRSAEFVKNEPYSYPIQEKKNNPIYNAHSYHTHVPPEVIMNYYLYYTQPGDIVLDNFAGTGMEGVAANYCSYPTKEQLKNFTERWLHNFAVKPSWGNRNCILGDLSPIASYITYNYCNSIDVNLFKEAANHLFDLLENEFGHLYKLQISPTQIATINYIVWSEEQLCPDCNNSFVYWDTAIDITKNEQKEEYSCPHCGRIIKKSQSIKLMKKEYDPVLHEVTEVCSFVPVFVNYNIGRNRYERNLHLEERNKLMEHNLSDDIKVPVSKLKTGDKTSDPYRLGIYYMHQFYSKRNLTILARLKQLIEKYKCDERLKSYLRIWFTSCQSRLHMMNRYAAKHHRHVGPLANTFYVSATPTEISPFYFIKSKISDNALEINSKGYIVNQIASATNSSIKDNSIDYIFTDPPFGANIMYSELNFIWESWLNLYTNNKTEAISNKTQNKTLFDYQEIMTRCFKEYYRVLKPGKWITVEFSNTSASVWNSIQQALQTAGFVISSVTDLNKGRAGLHGIVGVVAVNQDLAISCYKPTYELINKFEQSTDKSVNAMDFIEELLYHLPVHLEKNNSTTAVVERSPKILYDRLISYYVQHGYAIPMDAQEFQQAMRDRFIERDGMFFTASQTVEYESKKEKTTGMVPMALFISSEAEGVEWLKRALNSPQTYQEIQPQWMKDLTTPRKGDVLPELAVILEENFIKDEDGKWRKPDAEKAADLEILRGKKLMKEFNLYLEQASKPKAKRMKDTRLEVLRYGFKECYKQKNYQAIVTVGDHIQESLLQEDEVLLQYYDIASMRV